MEAVYRLLATVEVDAKGEVSEWWHHLAPEAKKSYISEHPASKYADQAAAEGEEKGHEPAKDSLQVSSKERSELAGHITKDAKGIASSLKRSFPKFTHAVGALKNLAQGKPLEHEHKEVLTEMGELALRTAAGKLIGGNTIQLVADVGITAVKYAIEHFKEKHAAHPEQDVAESFVEAVGEGVEKADHAPIPDEHAKPSSEYRSALSKNFKKASGHLAEVLTRSFPNIKPATAGLRGLTQGKKPSHEQMHALKHLGKHALMLSIATLPGGLAAHLTAGVAASAVDYGIKKMRQNKADKAEQEHKHEEPERSLVGHFMDAIGEGIEHAAVSGHIWGHHGGHGGEE